MPSRVEPGSAELRAVRDAWCALERRRNVRRRRRIRTVTSTPLDPMTLARRVLLHRLERGSRAQPSWLSAEAEQTVTERDKDDAEEHLKAIASLGYEVRKR